jgi:hypothetical protein
MKFGEALKATNAYFRTSEVLRKQTRQGRKGRPLLCTSEITRSISFVHLQYYLPVIASIFLNTSLAYFFVHLK